MKSCSSDGFKAAKLGKTGKRRKAFANEAKVAEIVAGGLPNDLVPSLEILLKPIEKLKPAKRRTRKTTPAQLEAVLQSLQRFGFVGAVLVRGDIIVDGHVRLEAMKKFGETLIPVIDVSHLSEDASRLLSISMNRIGETGTWDMPELRIELLELKVAGFDLGVANFSLAEQDIIFLDPEAAPGSDLNEVPPEPAVGDVVSRLGDLWAMEKHRLLCADALKLESYTTLMGDERATCILEDSPYNVPIAGNVSGLGKVKHGNFVGCNGEYSEDEFCSFLETQLSHCRHHLIEGGAVFSFMDWRSMSLLERAAKKIGLAHLNTIVWDKQSPGMGAIYRSAHEFVGFFCNGSKLAVNNIKLGKHGRDRCNLWRYPGANTPGSSASKALKSHPTPKDISLLVDAILDVTHEGDIVLDPFMGSGSTIIACAESLRVARGLELDPKYVDVAVRRWERLTGQSAVLVETGETFAEVAARRAGEAESN